MIERDDEKFSGMLIAAGELYNKTLSTAVIGIYWNALKNYDLGEVQRAFSSHAADTDNGQFMPKPADLIRHIQGSKEGRALQAWSKVEKAIRTIGHYDSVVFDDPFIHQIIDEMGGWCKVCGTSEDEMPFKSKEFEKRYRAALLSGLNDIQPILIGSSDAYNARNGFEVSPPRLVGKEDKCQLIMNNHVGEFLKLGVSDG